MYTCIFRCAQLQEAINSVMTDRDNLTRQHAGLKEQFTSLEENLASKAGGENGLKGYVPCDGCYFKMILE